MRSIDKTILHWEKIASTGMSKKACLPRGDKPMAGCYLCGEYNRKTCEGCPIWVDNDRIDGACEAYTPYARYIEAIGDTGSPDIRIKAAYDFLAYLKRLRAEMR